MHEWPCADLMNLMNRDAPAIGSSVAYVRQLLREEQAVGTPADRIVIGGFSQACGLKL